MPGHTVRVAKGELEILRMLWDEGPLALGEAHRRFESYGKPVSYPTMQTRLNRMVAKGLISRSPERPAHYGAVVSREAVTRGHLHELLGGIGGDVVPLVAHLLSGQRLTEEQVAELRQLLDEASSETKPRSGKGRTS